jgi:hypothetical protein
MAWEDGLMAVERTLRKVGAEHTQTDVIQQDYLTRSCNLTSCSKHSIKFNRMLEER